MFWMWFLFDSNSFILLIWIWILCYILKFTSNYWQVIVLSFFLWLLTTGMLPLYVLDCYYLNNFMSLSINIMIMIFIISSNVNDFQTFFIRLSFWKNLNFHFVNVWCLWIESWFLLMYRFVFFLFFLYV